METDKFIGEDGTLDRDAIIQKINEFLIEEFEVEEDAIEPDANMQEALDLDSLDYVDLVVVIEDNFGFKVQGEDLQHIRTFQDFYDFVFSRLEKGEKETGDREN
jgi:acyl carrier protein